MSKPNILITVPNQGWLHKFCVFALLKIQQDTRTDRTILLPTHKPYENSLNKIVNDFLAGTYDYWISFDDDNPPTQNIIDLVFLDKDVIGCPTPVWHNAVKGDRPWYFNAMDRKNDGWIPHEPCQGLQAVDTIGSGCFVIARHVIEQMRKNKIVFQRVYKEDGTVERGHDFEYFDKVKQMGYGVYAHYDYYCSHLNEIDIIEIINAFGSMR